MRIRLILSIFLLLYAARRGASSDCPTATIRLSRSSQTVREGEPMSLTFDFGFTCTVSVGNEYTIGLTYSNGESIDNDYVPVHSFVIPTGVLVGFEMIEIVDDCYPEDMESFTVSLASITSSGQQSQTVVLNNDPGRLQTKVIIQDDDTIVTSLSPGVINYNEGSAAGTVTVTLEFTGCAENNGDFSQTIDFVDNTAIGGADFTLASTVIGFPADLTHSILIPVPITDDDIVERDEVFSVTLLGVMGPDGLTRTDAIQTSSDSVVSEVTIEDDDVVSVGIENGISVAESMTVPFVLTYEKIVDESGFQIEIAISGSAEDSDYIASFSTVTMGTEILSETFSLTFIEDDKTECDETVTFSVSSVSPPNTFQRDSAISIGAINVATFTIIDNDDVTLSVVPSLSASESDGQLTMTLQLSNELEDIGYSATITLIPDKATAEDFLSVSTVVDLPTFTSEFTYPITINNDDIVEDDETFTFSVLGVSSPCVSDPISISQSNGISTITIEDDDIFSIGLQQIGTVEENAGILTGSISLSLPAGGIQDEGFSITLDVNVGDTTLDDHDTSDLEVSIPTTGNFAYFTISLFNDNIYEDLETFSVTLSAVSHPFDYIRPSNEVVQINNFETIELVTIEDDDEVTLAFCDSSLSVEEGTVAIVTMKLSSAFQDDGARVGISYSGDGSDQTALADVDYTTVPTLALPKNEFSVTLSLTINDDKKVEDTETIELVLGGISQPQSYIRSPDVSISATSSSFTLSLLNEDDIATIQMSSSCITVTEADDTDTSGTVYVGYDKEILIESISIGLQWVSETALQNDDFIGGPTSLVVSRDTLSDELVFTVSANNIVEDDESFLITLTSWTLPPLTRATSPIAFGTQASLTTKVVIKDDDTGTLCFETSSGIASENDGSIAFGVTTDILFEDDFTLSVTFSDDTATHPNDFMEDELQIVLTTGLATSSFQLGLVQDNKIEDTEVFTASLVSVITPPGFIRNNPAIRLNEECSEHSVTITDDDTATLKMDLVASPVPEDNGFFILHVDTRGAEICENGFSLTLTYVDYTTDQSNDYMPVTTVSIPTTEGTNGNIIFIFPILTDDIVEDDEKFCVVLDTVSGPEAYTRDDPVVISNVPDDVSTMVTIEDDDSATCSFSGCPITTNEGPGATATSTIECDKLIEIEGLSIDLSFQDVTSLDGFDFSGGSLMSSVNVGISQTSFDVSIEIMDDLKVEHKEEFLITLTSVRVPDSLIRDGSIVFLDKQTCTVSVCDDDTASCSITPDSICVTEGTDVSATVTVECDLEFQDGDYTITLSYDGEDAKDPDDFMGMITSTPIPSCSSTFNLAVPIVNDEVPEDTEIFRAVLLSGSDGRAAIQVSTSTVSIKDDDTLCCSMKTSELSVEEVDATATVEILCEPVPEDDGFSVELMYFSGDAEEATDYLTSMQTISIPSGQTCFSAEVPILDDDVVEDCESFRIELSQVYSPTSFSTSVPTKITAGSTTVTIKDDDTATCSFSDCPIMINEGAETTATTTIECDNLIAIDGLLIDLSFQDVTSLDGFDFSGGSLMSSVNVGISQTSFEVSIEIIDDLKVEHKEEFLITLTSVNIPDSLIRDGSIVFLDKQTCTVSVCDDDTASCSITPDSICVTEGTDFSAIVTVECDLEFQDGDYTLSLSYNGEDANDPNDFIGVVTSIPTLFSNTFSLAVPIVDDNVPEDTKIFRAVLLNGGDGRVTILSSTSTITIKDDDTHPVTTDRATTIFETTHGDVTTIAHETTDGDNAIQTTASAEQSTQQLKEETTQSEVTTADNDVEERNIDYICLTDDPCKGENVRCVAGQEGAECICDEGFQLESTERHSCIDIDECLTESCDDNQHCVNTDGSYHCSCNRGYKLASSGSCLDINECEDDTDDCHLFENTDCYNTEGTFACICKGGFIKDSNDTCIRVNDGCQLDFANKCRYPEGECMVDGNGNQECVCSPGFIRDKTSNLCTNKNECLESSHLCDKTANTHCVDIVPSVTNTDEFYRCECNEGYIKGRTGICLEVSTFRISLRVLAVNGNNASSLWSTSLQDSTSKKFSEVSNLFCSFFQESLASDSANMISCSGLAVERKNSDLKVALQVGVVSNSGSFNAETLEFMFIDASTLDHNGALMWKKSNGDNIVISSSSFDVELTDDINCSALECFNGGICVFDEKFYEIFCRCPEEYEGEQCQNEKREETIDQMEHDDSSGDHQKYLLIIGGSIASVVFLTLLITLCCLLQRSKNPSPWKAQLRGEIPQIVRNPVVRRRPVQRSVRKSEVSDQEEPNDDDVRMKMFAETFSRMGYLQTKEEDDENSSEDSEPVATSEFSVPYQADGTINV